LKLEYQQYIVKTENLSTDTILHPCSNLSGQYLQKGGEGLQDTLRKKCDKSFSYRKLLKEYDENVFWMAAFPLVSGQAIPRTVF
jgi:hypothetical protein